MLKSFMFDLDDTLLWDEKSIEKAFEATCEIADNKYNIYPKELEKNVRISSETIYIKNNKYNIDTKELEKNVRISAEAIYPQYETYEFVSNIGIGTFESFWGDFTDKGNEFEKLQSIQADYRKTSWENGLKALNINDEE